METTNAVAIKGDLATVFDLAARVEDWGRILPHYRYVKVLHIEGNRKWVEMSAWRDFLPVTWTAIQTVELGVNGRPASITYQHIRGMVRGMAVAWWFEPRPEHGDVLTGITHVLERPPFPTSILGQTLTELIVGRGFVGYIAGRTLLRIKALAEQPAAHVVIPASPWGERA